jgi:hypothetical protein
MGKMIFSLQEFSRASTKKKAGAENGGAGETKHFER